MTHKQKRLFARLRLKCQDAEGLSDRAIARELGVSQPFVSALRKKLSQKVIATKPEQKSVFPACDATNAQQALDRHHYEWRGVGRVRRISLPVVNDTALRDFDPYE